jgi:putative flippase GtrA
MHTTASPPIGSARGPGLVRRSVRAVLTRAAISSLLAGVTSETVLLVTYGPGLLGPQAAAAMAWAAGAVVNYRLNRGWAWGRRGRADLWRELLPYWAITLTSLAVSVWTTGLADRIAARLFETEGLRSAFVGGAFLTVYGLMFLVKFTLYHFIVFRDRPRTRTAADGDHAHQDSEVLPADRRSRHQVPTTTRK